MTVVTLEVEGHPHLDLRREEGSASTVPVVAPRRDGEKDGALFMFRPENNAAFRRALEGDLSSFTGREYVEGVSDIQGNAAATAPTVTHQTVLTATVQFVDAGGHRWETVFSAPAVVRSENDHQIDSSTRHESMRRL